MNTKKPQVETIERSQVMEALKDCPKIVKDYILALERAHEVQKELTGKAIAKLRQITTNQQ